MKKYSLFLVGLAFFFNSCSFSAQKPKLHTVEIRDMKFVPDDLTIQKGDTVRWVNRDIMAHDVTEEGNTSNTSSLIPSGESWETEITSTFQYYCSIHMVMKGQVKVD